MGKRPLTARQVERARVILLAAAGKQDLEIARRWASVIKKLHVGASDF
jgi:hypothetical protein